MFACLRSSCSAKLALRNNNHDCFSRALARPSRSRVWVVRRAEEAERSCDSPRPLLAIPIAEVDAHMEARQWVASLPQQVAEDAAPNSGAAPEREARYLSGPTLEAKGAALTLDVPYLRSKLQELLLLMPEVSQAQLLSLQNDALKDLVHSTAAVAARLVQLRTRCIASIAVPAGRLQQQQQQQQLHFQHQPPEPTRDSLNFIWKNPELLVSSDWNSFLTRTPLACLYGHTGSVTSVAVTPDGRHALSGSRDKTLQIWDLQACTCIASLQGHTDWVLSVAITPDGRYAVSGSLDATLRVWDLQSYTCVATLEGHALSVNAVAITPDGCHAVSGSDDAALRIWDLRSHTCSATLTGLATGVTSVAISSDGRRAISGCRDATLRVWDLQACTCTETSKAVFGIMTSLAVTPGGCPAVSGGFDGRVRVWDLHALCIVAMSPDREFMASNGPPMALTPDGLHALTGGRSNLKVWDLQAAPGPEGSSCTAELHGHTAEVSSVAITPDGCYAVAGSSDGSLCVWDVRPHTREPDVATTRTPADSQLAQY